MIKVGIAGIGFMGMTHYRAYQQLRGVKVVALAEPNRQRLAGDWRDIKGNFGAPGEQMDLQGVRGYEDWRDLVADGNLDLIDVCLPPTMHAEVSIAGLKAGKHVFCEKPISLKLADAEKMVRAAKDARRLLMIGHVLPFFPEYAFVRQAVASKKYGALLGGHFKRIISDPTWLRHYYDPQRVGGPVLDLHIHDAHFIRMVCGMPSAVFSTGRTRGDVVSFVNSTFQYGGENLSVSAASGVIDQQGRPFMHGFEIYFERATVLFEASVLDGQPSTPIPLTVLMHNSKVAQPNLRESDAFVAEISEVLQSVKSGKPSAILAGDLARDALEICHAEIESVRKGRLVKFRSK